MADRGHGRLSPPKRPPGTSPAVKRQPFSSRVDKKVKSALVVSVGGERNTFRSKIPTHLIPTAVPGQSPWIGMVRQVPTNLTRRVQGGQRVQRNQKVQEGQRSQKMSEYTAKKIPEKTSVYGKKKNVQMTPVGNGNVTIPPSPDEPVDDVPKNPDPELKRQFNKLGYEIIGHLGSGTYAEVWKVTKQHSGKIWAAKVVQVDRKRTSENYQFKFLPRELDALSKISHKNIIKVYQLLQLQKFPAFAIVMEWAPGGTLADIIRREGPLPESRVRMLMSPVFDAILYLHNMNYAHRDIKLENMLLSKRGHPKITDFSYVLDVSSTNGHLFGLSTTFCGTEPYLAPEIITHTPYNPLLSDVWALGVSLFVLTNNTLPFKCGDKVPTEEIVAHMRNRDWKFREKITLSNQFTDLIYYTLEPDPRQRLTIVGIINHPWTKI